MSLLLNTKKNLAFGFSLLELLVAIFIISLLSVSCLTTSVSLYKKHLMMNTLNKKNFSLQQVIISLQNDFSFMEKIDAPLTLTVENNCIKKMCFQIQPIPVESVTERQFVTYLIEKSALYRITDGNDAVLYKPLLTELSYMSPSFYYQGAWHSTVSNDLTEIQGVYFKIVMENEEIYEVAIYLGGTE